MHDIITVIGAKGKVGLELLNFFSDKGIYCRALTRDLKNIVPLPYVTWIGGDLSDTPAIRNLVAGSTSLFLNIDFSPKMAEIKKNVIAAAKTAGVKHIAYLSYGLMPEEMMEKSNSPVHRQHIEAEQALIGSGLYWTIIRPSGFMQSWLSELSPAIRAEKKFHGSPGDGKLPYIDTRDIAEIIAEALAIQPKEHYNKIYELTGNEPISFYQLAEAISLAIGDTVTYITDAPEDTQQRLRTKGYPEWAVQLLLYFAKSQREGLLAYTTPTLPGLLGRPARDVYTFARDYAAHFSVKQP